LGPNVCEGAIKYMLGIWPDISAGDSERASVSVPSVPPAEINGRDKDSKMICLKSHHGEKPLNIFKAKIIRGTFLLPVTP
jgi:hypothetical protein